MSSTRKSMATPSRDNGTDVYVVKTVSAPASRNDAMDMRVQTEPLIPRVQYAEETNFRALMSGIASDFEKGFRTGA